MPSKVPSATSVRALPAVTSAREKQFLNASAPIVVKESGNAVEERTEHCLNALPPITRNPEPKLTERSEKQPANASSRISVTVSGSTTEVMVEQSLKAPSSMTVTFMP